MVPNMPLIKKTKQELIEEVERLTFTNSLLAKNLKELERNLAATEDVISNASNIVHDIAFKLKVRSSYGEVPEGDTLVDSLGKVKEKIVDRRFSTDRSSFIEPKENPETIDTLVIFRQLPDKLPVIHDVYFRNPQTNGETKDAAVAEFCDKQIAAYLQRNPDMRDAKFYTQLVSVNTDVIFGK